MMCDLCGRDAIIGNRYLGRYYNNLVCRVCGGVFPVCHSCYMSNECADRLGWQYGVMCKVCYRDVKIREVLG